MDKEKIVMILLLTTIVLSVVSVLLILDFDTEEIPLAESQVNPSAGNVQLVVESSPVTGEVVQ